MRDMTSRGGGAYLIKRSKAGVPGSTEVDDRGGVWVADGGLLLQAPALSGHSWV